jgi:uncharacterized protein with beta-barrel porin domain
METTGLRLVPVPRWQCSGASSGGACLIASSPVMVQFPFLIRARYLCSYVTAAVAALVLMVVTTTSGHAQAPSLLTAGDFGVLAGSTVTNTGATVINGDVGVSPGTTITGFPPGVVNGTTHLNDAVAVQAQVDNTAAYNALASRPPTADLTGQDLGGQTLVAGVYNFNASAQLTGALTLNGQGNPNSVFIFNIGSTLTTASASSILLINGAQGGNVFFRVGSSATLGTTTQFTGNILALASITLNTGANINCGSALAQTGAVTLDANNITICVLAAASASSVLPSSTPGNEGSVAAAIDAFVAAGGTLPAAFQDLLSLLSPSELAAAFSQLSGEAGTGVAQAGTQAMNSFLSLVTNPFDNNRPFAEPQRGPMVVKALGIAPESPQPAAQARSAFASLARTPFAGAPDPRRWGIWAAGFGGQSNAAGNVLGVGSHDRSVRAYGYATGLDYRVTPATVVGLAFAGGGTNYGLSDGLGGGRSEMFQAAVYSSTRHNAAYISSALAFAWHHVSTDRYVTLAGTDHLTADFSAYNIGGRIEGGYRFAIPNAPGLPGQFGFTPYAAVQAQAFRTPSYSENAVSGSPIFALAYDSRTTTTVRTELGAWYDWSTIVEYGTTLVLRTRAAWAHDFWSDPTINAMFQALPGSTFTVTGAAPATDLLLASAAAEMWFGNGFSLAARFDGEFAEHSQKYAGTGRVRYTW